MVTRCWPIPPVGSAIVIGLLSTGSHIAENPCTKSKMWFAVLQAILVSFYLCGSLPGAPSFGLFSKCSRLKLSQQEPKQRKSWMIMQKRPTRKPDKIEINRKGWESRKNRPSTAALYACQEPFSIRRLDASTDQNSIKMSEFWSKIKMALLFRHGEQIFHVFNLLEMEWHVCSEHHIDYKSSELPERDKRVVYSEASSALAFR